MQKIIIFIMLLSFINCSTYNISKESFVEQLSGKQTSTIQNVASLGLKYSSNQLKSIVGENKKGKTKRILIDKNVTLKIFKSSNDKTNTIYFDTAYLKNDTLFGLKSRLFGGKLQIPLNDIQRIEIKTEMQFLNNSNIQLQVR